MADNNKQKMIVILVQTKLAFVEANTAQEAREIAEKISNGDTEPKQWFFGTNLHRPMTWAYELDFKGITLSKGFKL